MNIIWLSPEVPYPPIGGRNGVYNRIVQLSKYNKIYLFSIAYSEEERKSENAMKKYCEEVHYYNRNSSRLKSVLKSIIHPYSVASRTIEEMKRDIANLVKATDIQIVITDFPNMARNIFELSDSNIYFTLNEHNIEYRRMRDMVYIKTIPIWNRIAYFLESYRLERYEDKLYKKELFKSITFFSKDDKREFHNRWPNLKTELALFPLGANGVHTTVSLQNRKVLLFVGRLDNIAVTNVEAVKWFCDKVYPMIKKSVDDVHLIIAGANPCSEVMDYECSDIEIIPNYDSIEYIYSLTDCVILPLLSGGGVKGKLLEAIAYGKLCITTPHGIEGTDFESGKHVLVADDDEEFARLCIEAIDHQNKYTTLVENALELFENKYEWEGIGEKYNAFLIERTKKDR